MSAQNLITIFGSTGKQGGSVIKTFLQSPELKQKYALRGITRNTTSDAAKALTTQGVEMVAADVNDVASLRAAVKGSYGVFGVTNFWDKDVLDKQKEIQQGLHIFEAVKAEGVKHFVWSTLPHIERLTKGVLKHVAHFDSKAEVADHIEANKGDMITSYFMPAAYTDSYLGQIHDSEQGTAMVMPFQVKDDKQVAWPVIDAAADSGPYVVGLFEGAASANGVHVHGVSFWTSPHGLLSAVGKNRGKDISFVGIAPEEYSKKLPPSIAQELTETMQAIGQYSYYGLGSEKDQAESDKWMVKGSSTISMESLQ